MTQDTDFSAVAEVLGTSTEMEGENVRLKVPLPTRGPWSGRPHGGHGHVAQVTAVHPPPSRRVSEVCSPESCLTWCNSMCPSLLWPLLFDGSMINIPQTPRAWLASSVLLDERPLISWTVIG